MARPTNYTNPIRSSAASSEEEGGDPTDKLELSRSRMHRVVAVYGSLLAALFCTWVVAYTFTTQRQPPDLSDYVDLQTLSGDVLDLKNPLRRVIMVGDLHGMLHSLNRLLVKMDYDSKHDMLIHLGDITSKGPHSNELLSLFASKNITGVRGNNDQKVLEWYNYFRWVRSEGAEKWLERMMEAKIDPKEWKRRGLGPRLKFPIPGDWEWGGDHYMVARNMNATDYEYLRSLPIVLHLPSLHTLLVHAGILPMNPRHSIHRKNQPLARLPKQPQLRRDWSNVEEVRNAQELLLLSKVEGNRDPYIKLNMRDVHDGIPMRRGPSDHPDTTPWSELWNDVIDRCGGFNVSVEFNVGPFHNDAQNLVSATLKKKKKKDLPCYPITAVYSHASGRGLDLKPWSKGLDTGCVNGNGLTAMVLGKGRHYNPPPPEEDPDPNDHDRDIEVPYGERHHARLVSVSCPVGTLGDNAS